MVVNFKDLVWSEKILSVLFKRYTYKIYKQGLIDCFNLIYRKWNINWFLL